MKSAIPDLQQKKEETRARATERLGTVVADTYCITRHVGSGGSSQVFEAVHVRLGKPFAIKLLRAELDTGRQTAQRLRREATAIARLSSEHVVSVVDCGELEDRTPYLVMELLQGEDLRALLNREVQLAQRRAVPLLIQACLGTSAVHAAGLIHRDLKPENLFISRRATGQDWCKVLDFGVAKMDDSASTTPGTIVGTVRYMAPEQLSGDQLLPSTDVYALGTILYECLAGKPLHQGETVQQIMYSVMNCEPEQLIARCSRISPAIADALKRALSKNPADRPATPLELAQLLDAADPFAEAAQTDTTMPEDSSEERPVIQLRAESRHRRQVLIGIGYLGMAAMGWLLGRSNETPKATDAPLVPPERPSESARATPAIDRVVPIERPTTSAAAAPSAAPRASRSLPRSMTPVASASAAAAKRDVAVGRLDVINPYGE